MNLIQRLRLLLKRRQCAKAFGVRFAGTSSFRLPPTLQLCAQSLSLHTTSSPSHRNDFIDLFLDDDYGLRSLSFVPRTIADIGANIGMFSMLARHCFPSATIHAYEPNPSILAITRKNLEQVNVTIHSEGVALKTGAANLVSREDSRMVRTQVQSSGNIPLIGFAQVLQRLGGSIDLLKMDCEGAEWDIFQDTESFRHVRTIRMEYHLNPQKSFADLKLFADRNGFEVVYTHEGGKNYGIAWLNRRETNASGT